MDANKWICNVTDIAKSCNVHMPSVFAMPARPVLLTGIEYSVQWLWKLDTWKCIQITAPTLLEYPGYIANFWSELISPRKTICSWINHINHFRVCLRLIMSTRIYKHMHFILKLILCIRGIKKVLFLLSEYTKFHFACSANMHSFTSSI